MSIKHPRGTYDIYGTQMKLRNEIVDKFFEITKLYNFNEIQTPIFEETSLFVRAVGTQTDVVSKEMYTFFDRKNRSLTLRPELTAPIVRSYIEHKLYVEDDSRYCYYGPAFRYERPQKGRFRQFYQLGVESFKNQNLYHDAEIIILAYQFVTELGLLDNIEVKINTLGGKKERQDYIEVLKNSLLVEKLCDDCKHRINTNPLRVLDCKVDGDNLKDVIKLSTCLKKETSQRFESVLKLLSDNNIEYTIDESLVRGLDYYNDTVFEFEYTFKDGKKLALLGGGRYDNLVSELDGPDTPAFGFGVGIERIIDAVIDINDCVEYPKEMDVIYMPLEQDAYKICFDSMIKLKKGHIRCYLDDEIKSFKANFKKANAFNAVYAIIIGEQELNENVVTVKNLISKESSIIKLEDFEKDILGEV